MKAPVGLLSRRPVCEANAACSARQGRSDFDALDPTGCGPLRLLRALGGTRILQAAAPTAPPCIRHWRRSSPLQTRGCSPLIIPRQRSKRKNASRFAQRIFFFASPICRPLSRCATAPRRGAGAADTAVSVTTPPVKMRLERPAGRDKREYKNNFSAIYGEAHAKPFQTVNTPPAGPKERGQMDKSIQLRLFGEKQAGRFDFLCVFM